MPPPKPSSTSSSSVRRFFSASLKRAQNSTSLSSRCISGPSSSTSIGEVDIVPELQIPDYQWKGVLCTEVVDRTRVRSGGAVTICDICAKAVTDMRFMIKRFDATGSVKGTSAFEEFLMGRAGV